MSFRPILLPLIVAAGLLSACSDSTDLPSDPTPTPAPPAPASIRIVSGDQQHGTVGQGLPLPVVVQVQDSVGDPVFEQAVTFAVISGAGSISADTVLTNASGLAQVRWTLGSTPGDPQVLLAQLVQRTAEGRLLYVSFTAFAEASNRGLPFNAVAAGLNGSCGLTVEGKAYCWGGGMLGNGSRSQEPVPAAVSGGLTFVRLTANVEHACALTGDGAAYCWGENPYGELGDGTTNQARFPVAVSGGLVFQEISAGPNHTCALTPDGAAYCWGDNSFFEGQLGDGTTTDRLVPTPVLGGLRFSAIEAGSGFSCALTADGRAYCWGRISRSTLVPPVTRPEVIGGDLRFTSISLKQSHACALTRAGSAYCWGDNTANALGVEGIQDSGVPVAVSGDYRFQAISVGLSHTCGITLENAVACWGWDDAQTDSRLFNGGNSIHSITPVPLPGGLQFLSIDEGQFHGCGITTEHAAYCWFDGTAYALGNGSSESSYAPVAVR